MLASRDAALVAPAQAIFATLLQDPDVTIVTPEIMGDWPPRVRRRVGRYGRFKRWM
ncbi:hypothetical protein D3C83_218150 [compost metagenome]